MDSPTSLTEKAEQTGTGNINSDMPTPSTYSPGFTWGEMSGWLAFGIPLLYLLMALVEGSSYIWRPIAIALYVILLFLSLIVIVILNFFPDVDGRKEKSDDMIEFDVAVTLLGAIAVLVSFSQLSRHLYLLVDGGFVADKTSYWHWLRYGFSNMLESVLFDIPAIYEWNISEVKAISWWSQTIIFTFRTVLEFLVVAAALRQARAAWQQRHNPPKDQPRNYFDAVLPRMGHLLLTAVWGIPLAVSIGAVINDGLSFESTWAVTRLGTPVFFGAYLGWHSLRALRLSGKWNKVLALAGLAGGIWIVQISWPAFRAFLAQ